MSGGTFNYIQHRFSEIIEGIEHAIRNNNSNVDDTQFCEPCNYNEKTIEEFKTAIKTLKIAQVYAQRIDYLIAGDDGEETFHKRLEEDLSRLNNLNGS